jgi:hypothetical protein
MAARKSDLFPLPIIHFPTIENLFIKYIKIVYLNHLKHLTHLNLSVFLKAIGALPLWYNCRAAYGSANVISHCVLKFAMRTKINIHS